MIKRVLLVLDDSPTSKAAQEYALDLYQRHKNFLSALAVVDLPGIEAATSGVGIGTSTLAREGRKKLLQEGENKAHHVLTEFARRCSLQGIPNIDQEAYSAPTEAILHASSYFDLIVMGFGACPPYDKEDETETIRSIIRGSVCPVLGTPTQPRSIRRGLLAFDGRGPSARAMQRFALLDPFDVEELVLLNVTNDEETGALLLAEASTYLEAYGYRPRQVLIEGSPHNVIPQFARDEEMDCAVLGSYSGGVVKELFFGSLSKTMIQQGELPLFLFD